MSYKNRDLVRKPICMLRGSKEEYEKLTSLALRLSNGGAVAPTLLDLLLKRKELTGDLDTPDVHEVLEMLRSRKQRASLAD